MPSLLVQFSKRDLLFRLSKKEELLSSSGVKRVIGQTAKKLVDVCFARGQDPYGNPWAPLVYRVGNPLVLTGVLRGSFHFKNKGDDVELSTDIFYAPFHQQGAVVRTRRRVQPASKRTGRFTKATAKSSRLVRVPGGLRVIPRRPFLPDGRGMPEIWRKRIRDEVRRFTSGA